MEAQGIEAKFPREALKQAFQHDMIEDGTIWLEMLAKRKLLAHTYDEDLANEAHSLIVDDYYYHIEKIVVYFSSRVDDVLGGYFVEVEFAPLTAIPAGF